MFQYNYCFGGTRKIIKCINGIQVSIQLLFRWNKETEETERGVKRSFNTTIVSVELNYIIRFLTFFYCFNTTIVSVELKKNQYV